MIGFALLIYVFLAECSLCSLQVTLRSQSLLRLKRFVEQSRWTKCWAEVLTRADPAFISDFAAVAFFHRKL